MKDFVARLGFPLFEGEGGGGTGGAGGEGGTGGTGGEGGGGNAGGSGGEPPKTFTQEELIRIAATEKRQGAASVLKALGFDKEEDAKAFVEKYKEVEKNNMTELEKANKDLEIEKNAKTAAEKKADLLEKKFQVVAMGVAADKADDIVTLALAKVDDNTSFETVLENLKNTYPAFFDEEVSSGTGGTGRPPRSKTGGDNGGIGKRLAEQRKNSAQAKNEYFKN